MYGYISTRRGAITASLVIQTTESLQVVHQRSVHSAQSQTHQCDLIHDVWPGLYFPLLALLFAIDLHAALIHGA